MLRKWKWKGRFIPAFPYSAARNTFAEPLFLFGKFDNPHPIHLLSEGLLKTITQGKWGKKGVRQ
jgi:hypothetical protein